MQRFMRCFVATVTLVLVTGGSASAQLAYGIWNNAPGTQGLVTFNVNTPGTFNLIGLTGIASTQFINSLDFDGSGNLFLATNSPTNFLFDVNMMTGAATNPRGSGLAPGDSLGDLSYDRFSNRMLGVGTPGSAGAGGRLYSINTATGVATNLGTIGNFTEGFTVSLAVRPSDGLIFAHGIETDRWYTIDPGTLVATALGPLGWNTNFGQGASFDPVTGVLYHAMLTVDGGNMNRLATINTTTGAPTFLGTLGGPGLTQVGDIAFIPEPASLSVFGAAALGLLARRRSRTPAGPTA